MNFRCQDIVLSINGSLDVTAVEWQALLYTESNINDTICYTLGRVDIWTALCIIHISGGVLLAKEGTQVLIKVELSQGMASLPVSVLHFRVGHRHTGLQINQVETSVAGVRQSYLGMYRLWGLWTKWMGCSPFPIVFSLWHIWVQNL
jgi:hypothetical protein